MSRLAGPPESKWLAEVSRRARGWGWRVYHTLNSLGSAKGFPDLVMVRPPRLIVAELKSDAGKVRPEQLEWLDDLRSCGVEVYLWRPADVQIVMEILFQKDRPPLGGR